MIRLMQSKARISTAAGIGLFVARHFPGVRKGLWRTVYNTMHQDMPTEQMIFMNLGYAGDDEPALPSPIPIDHYPRQMYERVVAHIDLRDKSVLEVGCGRGGGAAHLHTRFGSRSYVGLDLTPAGIERCRARHQVPGLRFIEGDAMKLPFGADSLDAVVNIESSHCYPSRARFFGEVQRVLRPGGWFLFADLIWPLVDTVTKYDLDDMLAASGLVVVESEDITSNVVRSRDFLAADPSYEKTLGAWLPRGKKWTKESLFFPGGFHYECFADRRATYWRWVLQKPGIAS